MFLFLGNFLVFLPHINLPLPLFTRRPLMNSPGLGPEGNMSEGKHYASRKTLSNIFHNGNVHGGKDSVPHVFPELGVPHRQWY